MSFRIRCYTLFDITATGVINRTKPGVDVLPEDWLRKRNTQCNFDTILQVISLRSQPEIVDIPERTRVRFDNFGFLFEQDDEMCECWSFDFDIQLRLFLLQQNY